MAPSSRPDASGVAVDTSRGSLPIALTTVKAHITGVDKTWAAGPLSGPRYCVDHIDRRVVEKSPVHRARGETMQLITLSVGGAIVIGGQTVRAPSLPAIVARARRGICPPHLLAALTRDDSSSNVTKGMGR